MDNKIEREEKELEDFFTKADLVTEPVKPDLRNPDIDQFLDAFLSVSNREIKKTST